MKEIRSKLSGVAHKNEDGTSRQELIKKHCTNGTRLTLRTDPENEYGDTAVKAMIESEEGLEQIGWVKGGKDSDSRGQRSGKRPSQKGKTSQVRKSHGRKS